MIDNKQQPMPMCFDPHLTDEAVEELIKLLSEIMSKSNGLLATLALGFDGCVYASHVLDDTDITTVADCALQLYKSTQGALDKLNGAVMQQLWLTTDERFLTIADFGGGVLISVGSAQR